MDAKYKRMLDGMQAKEKTSRRKKREPWFLYILKCSDDSLYTGITKDLERRLKTHNAGRASHFTRVRLPVKLLYHEPCAGRIQALVREYAVKQLPRKKKEALIGSSKNGRASTTGTVLNAVEKSDLNGRGAEDSSVKGKKRQDNSKSQ